MARNNDPEREIFDDDLHRRAREAADDFLNNRWDRYMALVERMEAHPCNRPGADKTWVARRLRSFREYHRQMVRAR